MCQQGFEFVPFCIQEKDSDVDLMLGWGFLFTVWFFICGVGISSRGVTSYLWYGFFFVGWVFCIVVWDLLCVGFFYPGWVF